jgi:fatty-acyl-CoA synthase
MTIPAAQSASSDAKFARDAWLRALSRTADIGTAGVILPVLMDRLAGEFSDAPALISYDCTLSFAGLAHRSNQYARWGMRNGLKEGDRVCLFMSNCAEYLATWLGLTRIGVIVALVNSQLAGEALAHSIGIVSPRVLIVGAGLGGHVAAIRARLPADLQCRAAAGGGEPFEALWPELEPLSGEPLRGAEDAAPSIDRTALYIYTSGTTGLPKAAKVSHYRLMQWSHWFAGMMDTRPADRMFNCLPLYHSVGGVVAVFAPLVSGGSVVIRPRFSASGFWRDVREQGCTLFQYIGELCRYLLHSPGQEIESGHALRLVCGNGLRPEVWEPFKSRFRIPRILEYYASTEGNFSLYNCEGEPGAIGRIPPFLAARLPVALLRFDLGSGEPTRNEAGYCERCAPNEIGEAVGYMPADPDQRAGRFEGYADSDSSARKVLRNVFEQGDCWYRTGDLMRRDERGFYYFVDRVGETFRWKGENVSTAEVMSALFACTGVIDGVVYGVLVPGTEGRAGAAALVVSKDFDLDRFRADAELRLPAYARPVFLRILSSVDLTGTFKPRKQELAAAGFDPKRVNDPLYVDHPQLRRFVPLDDALFASICDGALRI